MNNWERKFLSELVSVQKGKQVSVINVQEKNHLPYIGAGSLENISSGLYADYKNAVICNPKDVLMLWDGERSGLVGTEIYGVVGSTVARFRLTNEIDYKFLYYSLFGAFRWIQQNRTGTGVPHVPKNLTKILSIALPPLPQQRKIAKILTTVDNLIEKTEALISKYQSIKQGMMHDLFTRGVDAKGKLRPPQSEAPELYKQSELGWIPKEWEVKRLSDIADIKGGKRLPAGQPFADSPTPFPYIRVSDMNDWSVDDSGIEYVPEWIEPIIRSYKISCHDLYISIAGVHLGLVGMVPEKLDKAQLTENAAKIIFKNSDVQLKEYLTAFFNSPLFPRQLEESKGIGAGVPKLALHRIEQFLLPMPRLSEQDKISNVLMECRREISNEKYNLEKLLSIKTALMQDLLTGKVQVTPDEIDKELAHA